MNPKKLNEKLELNTLAKDLQPYIDSQKELFVRVLDVAHVHFARIAASSTWLGSYTRKRVSGLLCQLIGKAKAMVEKL